MIGSFENTRKRTGYPRKNLTTSSQINSLIISDQSFSFASETLFEDHSQWIIDIKNDKLQVIKNLTDFDYESEKTEYIKSELDYEYAGKPGKYKYLFRCVYSESYHDYLSELSGRNLRVFLADTNYNIHGYLSGATVKGLDVDLFHIEIKKLPNGREPAWSIIKLILSDPNEKNLTTKMLWNPNRFDLIHIAISEVTGSGSYVDFTIKDTEYGILIDHLYISDISLADNAGGISVLMLTEKGCGQYRITATGALTYGTINVNSDRFYGTGEYIIVQDTVIFNNFVFESSTVFQVDVRYSGDLSLYTGLVLADFAMVDDTYGAVTISSVTEVSTGRYEIATSTILSTGDIDIDDSIVTGAGTYTRTVEVEILNITRDVDIPTNSMNFEVKTVISALDVTGLGIADFAISDTNNGPMTISAITEVAAGSYEATLSGAGTAGTISILTSIYYGSELYNFSTVTVINGGASGTTDFINPTDGVAERFTAQLSGVGSIVYAPTGFTGNTQQISHLAGTYPAGLRVDLSYFKTEVDYKLRFKYRISQHGTGADRFVTVLVQGDDLYLYETFEFTGYYVNLYESPVFQMLPGENAVSINWWFNRISMVLIIDEIELIEV